ncbi:uncharacterized protein LOC125766408 [Anopheles funestus]|uniref:uncharacterized protein LOC125766408 n=1 Tax=Anopheles funestus TaxID=62324 RepID=UPI0020C73BF3|nr:uncharacterized protein LOC125766408 [Anopheles funestus]
MSLKRSASDDISDETISKVRKSMMIPTAASKSKASASSVASGRKVVRSKLESSRTAICSRPKPPKNQPAPQATKQTPQASDAGQIRRGSAAVKMPDRSTSRRLDKTLSSIVKVNHKKDNGLPESWRKELYCARPGSAQARLENLRAALQKEVEEEKLSKAASSIPTKRTVGERSPPNGKVTSTSSTSHSRTASVTAVTATSAVAKMETVKHTVTDVSSVKHASTRPVTTVVVGKLGNTCGMDVDGVESNSPEPEVSSHPTAHNGRSFGRSNASAKFPNHSTSNRLDKTLSSIVKAKDKKDKGLPVAWRNELYGTRHGSAQARLENFRAALEKEIEEQNLSKAASSIPMKPTVDETSPPKVNVTPSPSTSQSNSAPFTKLSASSAIPEPSAIKHTDAVPEDLIVKQNNPDLAASNRTENLEDSFEMDVDETISPEPEVPLPSAEPASSKCMEYDSIAESTMQQQNTELLEEVKPNTLKNTPEETNDDSHEVASDLKTKYKDGLSAFANYFYCVIDTNIFIENYNDFQDFLSRKYSGSQPIVVVPYKVLHELDLVKHKKPQLGPKITPVVKFLHQMLRAKDARVKGQHPWDDTIELMPVHSPDDSIINCALQVQSVAASGNVKVVLVSNDCNMLTKAIVANLTSCTMEELQSDYKF